MSDRITVEQLVRLRIPRHELLIDLSLDEAHELFSSLDPIFEPRLIVGLDMGDRRGDWQEAFQVPIPIQESGPSLQDDIEAMIVQNSKNGEELRLHSLVLRVDGLDQTLLTTPDYWDCECDENYIHFHQAERCPRCGAERDSQPDARVFELLKHAPENAAWKFIGPDGLTVPAEAMNDRLRVYAESLRDPFAPDDADEQEAEFLSRLPLSEVCQLPPIKYPSNTPEPPAEPETVAETTTPSNGRQVSDQAGESSERAADQSPQDRALSIWNRYREQYPDEKPNRTVSRIPAYFPVPRPTTADVRNWLRAKGVEVPEPLTRAEVAAQARAIRAASHPGTVFVPRPAEEPKPSIEDVNAPMPLAGVGPEATVQLIHALARSARRRWPDDEKSIRLHIEDLGPLTQLRKVSDAAIALFDSMNRAWLDAYTDLPPFKQRDVDSALLAGWKKVAA